MELLSATTNYYEKYQLQFSMAASLRRNHFIVKSISITEIFFGCYPNNSMLQ